MITDKFGEDGNSTEQVDGHAQVVVWPNCTVSSHGWREVVQRAGLRWAPTESAERRYNKKNAKVGEVELVDDTKCRAVESMVQRIWNVTCR